MINPKSRRPTNQRPTNQRPTNRPSVAAVKPDYLTLFALFANEKPDGRIQIDIKAFAGKDKSIEDVFTLEEFLKLMTELYYGERGLVGSIWPSEQYSSATHSGNIRMPADKVQAFKEEFMAESKEPVVSVHYDLPEDNDEPEENIMHLQGDNSKF
jgi:hypothetical protein